MPLQNLVLAAFIIGAVSSAALVVNARTAVPFGHRESTGNHGPPWPGGWQAGLPLVWIVALLSARGTAQLLLRPRRHSRPYGYWLLALTAGLATLTQAGLDLFATRVTQWWRWEPTRWSWEGIALPNLAGSFVLSVVTLLLAAPALIDKRPVQPPPALLPLVVWFALTVAFMGGSASQTSEAAVALLAAPLVVVTVLAFQRGRAA